MVRAGELEVDVSRVRLGESGQARPGSEIAGS
jgi:hypothetical protein